MKVSRKWAMLALLVVPAAAVTFSFTRAGTRFRLGEVTRGEIISVINATGTVKPVRTISLSSPVPGDVVKIYAEHNAEVKKGQKLADVRPANSPSSEYNTIIAPADGIVMERQIEEGQRVGDQPAFTLAEDLNKEVHVYASIDEADIGLIRHARLSEQPVAFTVDAYPVEEFQGKIHDIRISPTVQQSVVTYHVVVVAPNPDRKLLPGMTAKLSFQIDKRENVVKIPSAALRFFPKTRFVHPDDRKLLEGKQDEVVKAEGTDETKDDRSAAQRVNDRRKENRRHVWMLEGEYLRAVEVATGLNDNNSTEMLSGDLQPGQKLVTGVK